MRVGSDGVLFYSVGGVKAGQPVASTRSRSVGKLADGLGGASVVPDHYLIQKRHGGDSMLSSNSIPDGTPTAAIE